MNNSFAILSVKLLGIITNTKRLKQLESTRAMSDHFKLVSIISVKFVPIITTSHKEEMEKYKEMKVN